MQILLGYNELGERERKNEIRKTETLRFVIIITRDPSDSLCVSVCVRMPFTGEWSSSI